MNQGSSRWVLLKAGCDSGYLELSRLERKPGSWKADAAARRRGPLEGPDPSQGRRTFGIVNVRAVPTGVPTRPSRPGHPTQAQSGDCRLENEVGCVRRQCRNQNRCQTVGSYYEKNSRPTNLRFVSAFPMLNAGTERCGRPKASELPVDMARPHSLQ